jgi:hypothetical protein
MKGYIKARLTETSTLRALVLLITSLAGMHLSETEIGTVISFGLLVSSLLGASLPDKLNG